MAGQIGCTTTTRLTLLAGSTTDRAAEELAAQPGAHARVTPAAPPLQPIAGATGPYAIVSHEPGWLTLSDHATSVRVPLAQVQSVSTYDHGRGEIDGAVAAGAVGFVLGFGASFLIPRTCGADSPCQLTSPVVLGLEVGAVVGLFTAALGVAVGGVVGHETRYEIASP